MSKLSDVVPARNESVTLFVLSSQIAKVIAPFKDAPPKATTLAGNPTIGPLSNTSRPKEAHL